jgi:putative transposase
MEKKQEFLDDSDENKKKPPPTSVSKIKLYPTNDMTIPEDGGKCTSQNILLKKMFGTHRAIYNKLVELSRDDCWKLFRSSSDKQFRFLLRQIRETYRPVAQKQTLSNYLPEYHLQVPEEVMDSTYRDFIKAIEAARALYLVLVQKEEQKHPDRRKDVTYPSLKFKSRKDNTTSIEMRSRMFSSSRDGLFRFYSQYFKFGKDQGIHFSGSLPVMSYSVRLQRTRENKYYICVTALKVFDQTTSTRVCAIDPGVRDFIAIYDPQGFTISVNDGNEKIFNQCLEIDRIQSRLSKSKSKRERYRLRKLKYRMHQRIKAKVADMHQKCSKWLSDNYTEVLLPKFATSQMTSRQNRISCSASRSMLTWSHYKFKKMLEYKMQRSGGRVIECTEEYTSKACTCCGRINRKLTGQKVYKCSNCNMVLDRDLNGARNIFLKNEHLLQLDSRVQLRGSLPRGVSIC